MTEGFSGGPADEGPGHEQDMKDLVDHLVKSANNPLISAFLKEAEALGELFSEQAEDTCPCITHAGLRMGNALAALSHVFLSAHPSEQVGAVVAAMVGVICTSSRQMDTGLKHLDANLKASHEEAQSKEEANRT